MQIKKKGNTCWFYTSWYSTSCSECAASVYKETNCMFLSQHLTQKYIVAVILPTLSHIVTKIYLYSKKENIWRQQIRTATRSFVICPHCIKPYKSKTSYNIRLMNCLQLFIILMFEIWKNMLNSLRILPVMLSLFKISYTLWKTIFLVCLHPKHFLF